MILLDKKKIAIVTTLSLMLTINTTVLAEPLSDQLKQQRNQLEQFQDTYDDIEEKIEKAEIEIEKMDEQIEDLMAQINETKRKIAKSQQDIKVAEDEVKKAEEELTNEENMFNKRIKVMYMNGVTGYLDVILDSKSIGDFLSRIDNIVKIIEYDKKVIKELEIKKQELSNKKQSLEAKHTELLALQKENNDKLTQLNDTKSKQVKMIEDLKNKQKAYADKIDRYEAMIDATLDQIRNSQNQSGNSQGTSSKTTTTSANNSSTNGGAAALASRGDMDYSSNAIIAFADKYRGKPYSWGASGPNSFDCSGFTMFVFRNFGINLPHSSRGQADYGVPVSRDDLQPGDLVFFGSPIHHVGIYAGNGMYIHAPRTGDVVKYSPMNRSDYVGARRLR